MGEKKGSYSQEMTKLWTIQLYLEFENICFQYRLSLKKPVIQVIEMKSRWGCWDPNIRTISLAKNLIESVSWDAVIEVLKHEMAHMIVNELEGIDDHNHGDEFKKAARLIGTTSWAQASEADLENRIPHAEESLSVTDQKLLRRVEKLLALAESSNEHEALLAMRRVRELYSRYNLDRLMSAKEDQNFAYKIINHGKKRVPQHQAMIASILTGHFFVEAIFSTQYDPIKDDHFKVLEIIGLKHNVKMAEYVYEFLIRNLSVLWTRYKDRFQGRTAKNSFLLGVLQGFDRKLYDASTMRSPSGSTWQLNRLEDIDKSLSVVADKEREGFLKYRHPRVVSRRLNSKVRNAQSFREGHKEGGQLVLKKAIEKGHQGQVLKLL